MAGSLTPEEVHRLAREKGVSSVRYSMVRGLAVPFMRLYFRLRIEHPEHIPAEGPAIVAPNHKSFWDSFFVAAATKRHVRFMGKAELFKGRHGRLLVRLGAFPVRRGESDADALETARVVLQQGGLLALFPEGTRIRDPATLGSPRRGAARLALETGASLVPAAITGTDRLFMGPLPKPKRVQIAFGPLLYVPLLALHATLAVRFAAPWLDAAWRAVGAAGNAAAIVLFMAAMAAGATRRRRSRTPMADPPASLER